MAVNRDGTRLGKGPGYSDLEVALLAEAGLIGPATVIVTTVHPLQVLDDLVAAHPANAIPGPLARLSPRPDGACAETPLPSYDRPRIRRRHTGATFSLRQLVRLHVSQKATPCLGGHALRQRVSALDLRSVPEERSPRLGREPQHRGGTRQLSVTHPDSLGDVPHFDAASLPVAVTSTSADSYRCVSW